MSTQAITKFITTDPPLRHNRNYINEPCREGCLACEYLQLRGEALNELMVHHLLENKRGDDLPLPPAEKLTDKHIMPCHSFKGFPLSVVPNTYWLWFIQQDMASDYPQIIEYANKKLERIAQP